MIRILPMEGIQRQDTFVIERVKTPLSVHCRCDQKKQLTSISNQYLKSKLQKWELFLQRLIALRISQKCQLEQPIVGLKIQMCPKLRHQGNQFMVR